MRTSATSGEDRPAAINTVTIPPILCNHPEDVAEVTPLADFCLHVRFHDGVEGRIDMGSFVHSPGAGVFSELADPAHFAQVYVEHGAVTWPGELDLAPDAMYTELKEKESWTIE